MNRLSVKTPHGLNEIYNRIFKGSRISEILLPDYAICAFCL